MDVKLTAEDLQELERVFTNLKVLGNRVPEALAAARDIGVSIGTSSVGTHGKSPIP